MRLRSSLVAVALLVLPALARADAKASDPAKDPEVARLLEAGRTLQWNSTLGSARYGHAEALVAAPAEKVRDTAVRFNLYKEFHRKFASARIIAKEGDQTDVYLRMPVRIGPVRVDQWEVMRFGPPRAQGSSFVVEGRGVKGDMKQGHLLISVRPVDATHALLKVDLLLVPGMPAPQSMIDEELRDAALDFTNGLKDKAQGWSGPVTHL